jgi:hypothetical protein
MKIPNESFIPSHNLSSNLPIIQYFIPQNEFSVKDDYPISIEFLKFIGCRTIYIPSSSTNSNQLFETNQQFIEDLLKKRKHLSENDLKALKSSECIYGTTLNSNESTNKIKYKPNELHFPFVAKTLEWNSLLIVDWIHIETNSQEYLFLKELGVKEVPQLNLLISTIHQEYENQNQFHLTKSLLFFAQHFQQHYYQLWKNYPNHIPFIPSILSNQLILTKPQNVYKGLFFLLGIKKNFSCF